MGQHRGEHSKGMRPTSRTGNRKAKRSRTPWMSSVLAVIVVTSGWYYFAGTAAADSITAVSTQPDTLEVSWNATGADSYLVTVTHDEQGLQELAKTTSTETKATLNSLPTVEPGTAVYVRVISVDGDDRETSEPIKTWLKPQDIESFSSPVASPNTVTLKWSETTNTAGYQIQRADDEEFTKGVVSKKTDDAATRIVIHGLKPETEYFWRIRPINGRTMGDYSEILKADTTGETVDVALATYNICSEACGGIKDRRWRMAELVAKNNIDILAVQEAGGVRVGPVVAEAFASKETGLTRADGGAKTRYLFYDADKYRQLDGGWFKFGKPVHGTAWAKFEDRRSGVRFIIVSTHLSPDHGADSRRASQTKMLFSKLKKINSENVPVIYAGDFNSHRKHRSDGPEKVMKSNDYVNALELSASEPVNEEYSSFRSFSTSMKRKGLHVDKIYVPKDTVVKSWKMFFESEDGKYTGGKYSDHNPIKAVVAFKVPNPD